MSSSSVNLQKERVLLARSRCIFNPVIILATQIRYYCNVN